VHGESHYVTLRPVLRKKALAIGHAAKPVSIRQLGRIMRERRPRLIVADRLLGASPERRR
jgi:hypothetical protein